MHADADADPCTGAEPEIDNCEPLAANTVELPVSAALRFSEVRCLEGHAMARGVAAEEAGTDVWGLEEGAGFVNVVTCDYCGVALRPPSLVYSCSTCEFDLCLACAKE